jgi:hypothetical protein
MLNRRSFTALLAAAGPVFSQTAQEAMGWHGAREFNLEGKGWAETKAPYDRLPAKAEATVRKEVWNLSRQSAGLCVRFVTGAPSIHGRWTLISPNLALPHMAAAGVSGLDLYAKTDAGRWRWLASGRPTAHPANTVALASGIAPGKREYLLYFPLYNGVTSVEIGIPAGSQIAKAPARDAARKPIVFYGTSITQGASATRVGMNHVAIVGRALDREVINLGFSGNGRMEPEVARLLAELDPAVYVIDCLPNMSPKDVQERAADCVKILRETRPLTPILLVEDRNYSDGFLIRSRRERNEGNHAALRAVYEKLLSDAVPNLHYLPGDELLGDDGEGTVDGSHPTDLGFMRQAEQFRKALREILG